MPKIGDFDTDTEALKRRVSAHSKFGNAELNNWIFSCIQVREDAHILDVGCGFGKQTLPLLELGCSVTAVDASAESIESLKANAKSEKLKTINCNFDDLILPKESFDHVISSYAFYYSNNTELLLSKIKDSMKLNSNIFICGPSSENNLGIKNLLSKVGVTFGEGSAPFMEDTAPKIFEKIFGNVEILTFENKITFPTAESVWEYWSSHNMFDSSIETSFKKELNKHFSENDDFVTVKVARGILSKN
jgi:SAM-dependent methyltransferase